jgi:hypothetical protein
VETREAVTNEHGKTAEQRALDFKSCRSSPPRSPHLSTSAGTNTPERHRPPDDRSRGGHDHRRGTKDAYFATDDDAAAFHAELTDILLKQRAAFNSPVWFNVGIDEHPQCSACFINSVDDTMDSILTLAHTRMSLARHGSNPSTIRSKTEAHGGGSASDQSLHEGLRAFAGVIVRRQDPQAARW